MRVAVCLAGHMRTYDRTYESWYKNVLEPYTPDVFISSWMNRGTWKPEGAATPTDHGTVNIDDDSIDIDHIRNLYHPERWSFEHYSTLREMFELMAKPVYTWRDEIGGLYQNYRINSYISAFYKVWSAYLFTETYGPYDLIIMSRPDVAISPIPTSIFDNLDVIHIKPSSELKNGWMWNIMFASNATNASLIASVFPNYDRIFETAKQNNMPHTFFEPHNLLYKLLVTDSNKSIIDDINCEIVR